MFRKDHIAFGAMIGSVIPIAIYLLLELITIERNGIRVPVFSENTRLVLAVAANLLPFRQYMVKLKLERTGKGILLVTFIYAFAYLFNRFWG